ncbi:hypothetical protein AB6A40_004190 [Gnathostoma spinigerum]|uniref:Uridine diphosphate glucose pyrophosphatase NUDT14 n=1 Tax=Gnathostoma spinigerum TaxID=75299 RepID=A0ABD6ECU2_9BILA
MAASCNTGEYLRDVEYVENIPNSKYMSLSRLKFTRGNKRFSWDLAFRHDSVACVLYHREKNSLLFVKQFRPAVYLTKIRRMQENQGIPLNRIDYSKYAVSLGETIELCAGLIDKPKLSAVEHMREEILEECGYSVNIDALRLIKKFIVGIGLSGSVQHLFYAEINDAQKVNDGGGTDSEKIEKVWMTLHEAHKYCEGIEVDSAPGLLYGLSWFFEHVHPMDAQG